MSDYNPCCFCLGNDTDVPPFGRLSDAQAFVNPCSRCSLTTHRKCLLDWFSSLPSDKLKVVDALISNTRVSESHGESHAESADLNDDGVLNQNEGIDENEDGENFQVLISPQQISTWINSLIASFGVNFDPATLEGSFVLLLAPCPQCKGDITFSMKRSQILSLSSSARTALTRSTQYFCVATVVVSAVTGIFSLTYVALTDCGLRIMNSLVPGPLLVKMLQKPATVNTISLILDFNAYSFDNLELALSKGVIDPFKFSRIPILPIMLYRMRSSSMISCLLGITTPNLANSGTNSTSSSMSYNNLSHTWLTEIMINGYISSLGNHKLIKSLVNNVLNKDSLFKGVDFWNVNNMISLLIPLRWLYDLFYRLTINRLHFNLAMKIRPRDIANSLSPAEFERLEEYDSKLSTYTGDFQYLKKQSELFVERQYSESSSSSIITSMIKSMKKKLHYYRSCRKTDIPQQYLKTKLSAWLLETKACFDNDYSTTLLYKSFTLRCMTTILWPFLSSKLGGVIYNYILKNSSSNIPRNKLMLLANIIGLVGVVFLKDCVNLYLCLKKAQQISNMVVIYDLDESKRRKKNGDAQDHSSEQEPEPYMLNFPGGYSMSIRLR